MFKYIHKYFTKTKVNINHEKLSIQRSYTYDSWNKIENGQVRFDVHISNQHLGFVDFRSSTGQIGIIEVKEEYRQQGIANFMLLHIEKELLKNNVKKVWCVCSQNHYFWSRQKNYIFNNRPHESVTGHGYSKKIFD